MNVSSASAASRLPHGVIASAVIGTAAAGVGWLISGVGAQLTASYGRLDQITALVLGAAVGFAVAGARAFRHRKPVWFDAAAGGLLGGVGALAGASVLAFAHATVTPRLFVAERALAWALSCGAATTLLAGFAAGRRHLAESAAVGIAGGAVAGVLFTLPGVTEAWQGVAFLWYGATVGCAVAGPELWHAVATVELLPARGAGPNLLTMREWPLRDGIVLELGEAQVACVAGRIALYPPAGGVVAAGRNIRHPAYIGSSATIAVGRTRYQVQLGRGP